MADPSDRGWGSPGKTHGDAQAREYGQHHITTIETIDGSRFAVRKEVAPILLGFLDEIIGRGYKVKGEKLDDWGWYVRPIAGSKTLSNHSWGLAVDLNAMTNPQGKTLRTDMPAFVPETAGRWRLRWGGNYTNRPDGMHFEFIGSRDDALRFVRELKEIDAAQPEEESVYRTQVRATPDGAPIVFDGLDGKTHPVYLEKVVAAFPTNDTGSWRLGMDFTTGQAMAHASPPADLYVSFL